MVFWERRGHPHMLSAKSPEPSNIKDRLNSQHWPYGKVLRGGGDSLFLATYIPHEGPHIL